MTGTRPRYTWDNWEPSDGGGDGYGDGSGGGTGDGGALARQAARDAAIEARITIDASVPPEQQERAKAAEEQLEEDMKALDREIQKLGDDEIVKVGDKELTGAEIKEIWATLSFVITQDGDYGPKGGGVNDNGVASGYSS